MLTFLLISYSSLPAEMINLHIISLPKWYLQHTTYEKSNCKAAYTDVMIFSRPYSLSYTVEHLSCSLSKSLYGSTSCLIFHWSVELILYQKVSLPNWILDLIQLNVNVQNNARFLHVIWTCVNVYCICLYTFMFTINALFAAEASSTTSTSLLCAKLLIFFA